MPIDTIEFDGKEGNHRSKLSTPENARKVVRMLVEGASRRAMADELGVSRPTIKKWLSREDIRQWINDQAAEYIESLPNALELSRNVLDISRVQTTNAITRNTAGEITEVNTNSIDQKILDSALREVDNIRKAVGITPSTSTSVVIGQLVMGNNVQVLAPNVQKLLDHTLGDILDITVEGDGHERYDTDAHEGQEDDVQGR
jgi:transposase